MVFAHDTEEALQSAAALVNTAQTPDALMSVDDLATFYVDQGWKGQHAGDAEELEQVRALRPILRRMWLDGIEGQVECINGMLRTASALPQIVRHDEFDWHLHATTPGEPLAVRMAVEAAMAMVDVIRMGETERLKMCDAESCEHIFADLSRNRSRRYCSVSCSNRMAAAAYRTRQSDAEDAAPADESAQTMSGQTNQEQ